MSTPFPEVKLVTSPSRLRLAVVVSVLLVLSARTAWAQPPSVSGRVTDSQGASIARARLTLATAPTPRATESGADGVFVFTDVPAGTYVLTVEAAGFAAGTRTVTVGNGPQADLTIALRPKDVRESVTVNEVLGQQVATGRTNAPLRDLPLTIDTVGSERLAEQGTDSLVGALANVAGVNAFTTYGVYEYYSFRGFLDSVQLVDGVRNEGNRVSAPLTNVDRVEVLQGPSSALYGGGALGATVNVIRKKPAPTAAYDLLATSGSWGKWSGAVGATGRLGTDAVLYRLDVGADRADGYRHDDVSRFTVAPTVTWRVNPSTAVTASYTANRNRFGGDAGLPLVDADFGVSIADNVLAVPLDRNYRTPQDRATSIDQHLQFTVEHQLTAAWSFANTTAYRHFDDEYFLSEGLTFEPPDTILRDYLYFKHHRRPLSNTAELTGRLTKGRPQQIVFGWEGERYHNYTTLPAEDFFSAAPINAFAPVETQGPSDLTPASVNVFTNNTSAFYAQDHVTLAPQLKLLVGGRYDIYRRESHSDTIDNDVQTAGPTVRRRANAFTSRVGLVYQPAPRVDVYGSVATAFKPLNDAQPDGSSLEPETGSQVEVGQRLRLGRDRLEIDASAYRILRQNVAFRRPGNIFVQAGEVQSRGFEINARTAPTAPWQAQVGYGFTDASFLDYQPSADINLRGNTPVFAPRHTFTLWGGHQWSNGIGVNVGARYLGRTFADDENRFAIDGYGLLNLAVRYRRGELEYALNVNNVTNTRYFVAHQDYLQVYPGDPVNVLATVRVHLK